MDSLMQELDKIYYRKREKNQLEMKERKIIIYKKIPRIAEIDHQIAILSKEIIKILFKKKKNFEQRIKEFEQISSGLRLEKAQLLKNYDFPADYLQAIYDCALCKDYGYFDTGERCKCCEKEILGLTYQQSALHQRLDKENFEHFEFDVFSSKMDEHHGMSPRENMTNIYQKIQKFILDFKEVNDENYIFYGMTGMGKTFLLTAIAKELMDRDFTVSYQSAYEFFRIAEENKFSQDTTRDNKMNYQLIFESDLLLIDDLGTEMVNSFTQMELFNIINIRLLRDKKTIISTNLNPVELSQVYGERLFSRFIGHYTFLEFFGEDLRMHLK